MRQTTQRKRTSAWMLAMCLSSFAMMALTSTSTGLASALSSSLVAWMMGDTNLAPAGCTATSTPKHTKKPQTQLQTPTGFAQLTNELTEPPAAAMFLWNSCSLTTCAVGSLRWCRECRTRLTSTAKHNHKTQPQHTTTTTAHP